MNEYSKQELLKHIKANTKHKNGYIENIITIDTETTSICTEKIKYGFVYIWQLGIDDFVMYGRKLEELKEAIETLATYKDKRAVIYIQNLGFDFQFLRNIIKFDDVFARKSREVIKATYKNAEFRDLAAFTGLSLDELGKVNKLNNKKLHNFDYNKRRNTLTPLTQEELDYCELDILTMYSYLKEIKDIYKTFNNIPLTFTGIVRKELKTHIEQNYRSNPYYAIKDWKEYVSKMTPTPQQFRELMNVYAGGYCHSNPSKTNKVIKNVKSIDFTSSYPYVMMSSKLPMGRFYKDFTATLDNLDTENKAYILTLKFTNIRTKGFLSVISVNHVDIKNTHGIITDNGRIDTAATLITKCTEYDYEIISKYYDFDSVELLDCKSTRKDYLPGIFLEFIREKYIEKQQLKPFKDKHPIEYNLAKVKLNSLYGMCVTNYISDEAIFEDNQWDTYELDDDDIDEQLQDMRENKTQLLPICWGVWVTSIARYNILYCADLFDTYNVIYIDTDSIKYIDHNNKMVKIIENYNKKCRENIKNVCKLRGIEYKGLEGLGEFEQEPEAEEFKTLGAKKYICKVDGELKLTLSGVSKEKGIKAFKSVDEFKPGFVFSEEQTGKLGKYYNDEQPELNIVDEYGQSDYINQRFGVCLFPVEYRLDITEEYTKTIKNYNNCEKLKGWI